MEPEEFGVWLREARLRAGLNGSQLARMAGVTSAQIGNIERGKTRNPSPYTRRMLVRALESAGEGGCPASAAPIERKSSAPPEVADKASAELAQWREFARSLENLERDKAYRFSEFMEGFGHLCITLARNGLLETKTALRIRDICEGRLNGW